MKRLAAPALLVLLAACGGPPPSLPPVDIVVEKELAELRLGLGDPEDPTVTHRLDQRLQEHGVGAAAVALIFDGELRWVRTFGEAELETDDVWPVGELVEPFDAVLAMRLSAAGDEAAESNAKGYAERMRREIFVPLEMEHSRVEEGEMLSTAGDLARFVIDLQKAHAGKPARRLDQDEAKALLGTGEAAEGVVSSAESGLELGGTGHARYFHRRAGVGDRHLHLVGFIHSGHGAVVLARGNEPAAFADEMLAGLSELYQWPAFRAEGEGEKTD